MGSMDVAIELETQGCCVCGVVFAASAQFFRARQDSKAGFFCPNGHEQSFKETTLDRLRKELEQAQRDLVRAREAREAESTRARRAELALKRAKRAAGK